MTDLQREAKKLRERVVILRRLADQHAAASNLPIAAKLREFADDLERKATELEGLSHGQD